MIHPVTEREVSRLLKQHTKSKTGKPTLRDIARKSGVSVAFVRDMQFGRRRKDLSRRSGFAFPDPPNSEIEFRKIRSHYCAGCDCDVMYVPCVVCTARKRVR